MRDTLNAVAYQFFEGSRLHVVGIRIGVLQCITTLRENKYSVVIRDASFHKFTSIVI